MLNQKKPPKPRMNKYCFNLKCNYNGLSVNDLADLYKFYIYHLKKTLKIEFVTGAFELDSKEKLHLHSIIKASAEHRYSEFKMRGFMVWIKPMTNEAGWYQYMFKNPYQILRSHDMVGTSQRFIEFCDQYEIVYQRDVAETKQKFLQILDELRNVAQDEVGAQLNDRDQDMQNGKPMEIQKN